MSWTLPAAPTVAWRIKVQILVSGSLAYDRIMDFPGRFADHILPDKIHMLNVCFVVNGLQEKFGGTAGNIAYSLALLGEEPLVLASAGNDFDRYESWMEKFNLSVAGIRRIPEELTAGAYITTDKADNQITGFNPGAMKYPSLYQFDSVDPQEALAIVAPGNVEDMVAYSRRYKDLAIRHICDPGQQVTSLSAEQLTEIITGSHLLICNDYELEMIIQDTGLDKGELLQRCETIICTLGEDGSQIITPRDETMIPAVKPARVLDPTGVGDAYRAGLIKGLVLGKDLEEAAKMGATCASFAVECYGTQEHRFSQEQFWTRHEGAFSEDA
jgi:adenosine kinase